MSSVYGSRVIQSHLDLCLLTVGSSVAKKKKKKSITPLDPIAQMVLASSFHSRLAKTQKICIGGAFGSNQSLRIERQILQIGRECSLFPLKEKQKRREKMCVNCKAA